MAGQYILGMALWLAGISLLDGQGPDAATVTGQVREQRRGSLIPVQDCTVLARSIDTGPLASQMPDSEGRFVLRFPPASRVSIGTQCPGFVVTSLNGRRQRALTLDCSQPGSCGEVMIELQRTAAVDGFVVDSNGEPLENIQLMLRPVPQAPGSAAQTRPQRSDSRGYFRFYYVLPGQYELTPTSRPAYQQGPAWEGDPVRLTLAAGEQVTGLQLPMRLGEVFELTGRVEGLPEGTKTVTLMLTSSDPGSMSGFSRSVEVDSGGRFTLPGVLAGRYQVHMTQTDETHFGQRVYLGATDLHAGPTDAVFRRTEPSLLRGRILVDWPKSDDLPLRPASNRLFFRLESLGDNFSENIFATAEGPGYVFEQEQLRPGRYRFRFPRAGAVIEQRNDQGSWDPAGDIVLHEGAVEQLDLRVRFESGRLTVFVRPAPESEEGKRGAPAAHYAVGLRSADNFMFYPADQNGRLLISYFPRGDYEICAWRDMSIEEARSPQTWQKAGAAVRKFQHAEGTDMEILLTAAP